MCLLVKQPSTTAFTDDFLKDVYTKNSDGFGIMYADDGKVHVYKCLPANAQDFIDFYRQHAEGRDCVWHARMKTHGDIDMENCHPYRVTDDIWLAHNGILQSGNHLDKTKSDTWHFIRNILSPALEHNPDLMLDPVYQQFIGSMIGGSNKFGLVRSDGETVIINEQSGVNFVGAWLSNTYAWTPNRFGFRSAYQGQSGYTDAFTGSGRYPTYGRSLWEEEYEGDWTNYRGSNWQTSQSKDGTVATGTARVGKSYPVSTVQKTVEAKGQTVADAGEDEDLGVMELSPRTIRPFVRAMFNQWERRGVAGIKQWCLDAPHKAAAVLSYYYDDVEGIGEFAYNDPEEAAVWLEDLLMQESVTPSWLQ